MFDEDQEKVEDSSKLTTTKSTKQKNNDYDTSYDLVVTSFGPRGPCYL